jgi:hypothetical protein
MPERDIFVTEDDARKLRTLLVEVRERSVRDREHLPAARRRTESCPRRP